MKIYKNKKEFIEECISPQQAVLDIGFWGQGVNPDSPQWVHSILRAQAKEVWGIDMFYDKGRVPGDPAHYAQASAESFSLPRQFDVIFAGDLIEHLSNPGLFLSCARKQLNPDGRLIITTPNAFNIFSIAEKFSKGEPTVNPDHTCYFNSKTLGQLLQKNGWEVESADFIYTLGDLHRESWKKKVLNGIYWLFSKATPRFVETLAVIATPTSRV